MESSPSCICTSMSKRGFLWDLAVVVQDLIATHKLGDHYKLNIHIEYIPSNDDRVLGDESAIERIENAICANLDISTRPLR
ncbi:MAG: hypothetical protein HQK82_01100 [Desulfovibrionaceae bacterium]|nr:hypothetical protein [Desulfovibrionaceae bacterium]